MSPYLLPPTLQGLARSADHWPYLAQYLSLEDLGRLNSVSRDFTGASTPKMMERAALDAIRWQEREAVTAENLQRFRFHPAARDLCRNLPATACLQSLHLARKAIADGDLQATVAPVVPSCRMTSIDLMPLPRDGGIVCWHSSAEDNRPVRYLIRAGQACPYALPDGTMAVPRTAHQGGIGTARQFLVPRPDYWVLARPDHTLCVWRAGTAELADLPQPRPERIRMAAVSGNGRFVAWAAQERNGDCHLKCHDRELDRLCVDRVVSDPQLCQLSVASDGALFVGSQAQGYQFGTEDMLKIVPFLHLPGCLYGLSPDENFLIRSGVYSTDGTGTITLEDRLRGTDIVLLRQRPSRSTAWFARPASMAFSPLNALIAVAYHAGVIQVFDPGRGEMSSCVICPDAELPHARVQMQPLINFDGFNRIHTVFRHFDGTLAVHTLHLGHPGQD